MILDLNVIFFLNLNATVRMTKCQFFWCYKFDSIPQSVKCGISYQQFVIAATVHCVSWCSGKNGSCQLMIPKQVLNQEE